MGNMTQGEKDKLKAKGRPPKYKPEFCEMLIKHMAQGFSYESFSAECGTFRQTLYDWEKRYPAFFDAKKTGNELRLKLFEELGMKGMRGDFEKFSTGAWVFFMKNVHGWTDKKDISHKVEKLEEAISTSFIEVKDNDNTVKLLPKNDDLKAVNE